MKPSFPLEPTSHATRISLFLLALLVILIPSAGSQVLTQRSRGAGAKATSGTLKIQVPSGVFGDTYWIYVNGRLRSSPPHGTPPSQLLIIMLADGSGNWEGWNADGRVVTSLRIDDYLKSGDKFGIFRVIEYQVPQGTYNVEILVPGPRGSSFPFINSTRTGVLVRSGGTTEVYTSVPPGWSVMPAPIVPGPATGYSLCPPGSHFDINRTSDILLQWGMNYRNQPLRQSLLKAVAGYRPGDKVATIDVASGPRELDGQQIRTVVESFAGPPYTTEDIEYCKQRLPQYSNAFDEFKATIDGINRDKGALRKLADDLGTGMRDQ